MNEEILLETLGPSKSTSIVIGKTEIIRDFAFFEYLLVYTLRIIFITRRYIITITIVTYVTKSVGHSGGIITLSYCFRSHK